MRSTARSWPRVRARVVHMRVLVLVVALLVAGCVQAPAPAEDAPRSFPGLRFDTELGAFTVILYEEHAPQTVAFMQRLVDAGYYDGREFTRVIPGFVIQEVDRTGGTTDQDERVPLEAGTPAMFSAGALGIARDEDPDSGGSEFFVMDFAFSHLYGNFTVFAQVVEGMEVVRAIARVPAIETGPAAGAFVPGGLPVTGGVHDRVAVDPVAMTSVTRVTVEMAAQEAARYPLVVGPTARGHGARYTLEWPADLSAGRESVLRWYVYTSPSAPAPDLGGMDIVARDGSGYEEHFFLAREETDARILRWTWTPPARGDYNVTLVNASGELGFADLRVR